MSCVNRRDPLRASYPTAATTYTNKTNTTTSKKRASSARKNSPREKVDKPDKIAEKPQQAQTLSISSTVLPQPQHSYEQSKARPNTPPTISINTPPRSRPATCPPPAAPPVLKLSHVYVIIWLFVNL